MKNKNKCKIGKTLIGLNNYLFLINDSNQELKQHYDSNFKDQVNINDFLKYINNNVELGNKYNFDYNFFVMPDKSVVCGDNLPFEHIEQPLRIVNKMKSIPDFVNVLDETCYFKGDSHINYVGGLKLSLEFFKHTNINIDEETIVNHLECSVVKDRMGDLLSDANWGDLNTQTKNFFLEDAIIYKNTNLKYISHNLPCKYKYVYLRETEYYLNDHSLSTKKLLIFRDSSATFLIPFLSVYFKEILLYWDHFQFNTKLIEYYKPDYVFEIRTERFINHKMKQNMYYINNYELKPKNNEETIIYALLCVEYPFNNINNIEEIKQNLNVYDELVNCIGIKINNDVINVYRNILPNININDYKELNSDLWDLTEYKLIYHYVNYGYYEKRKCKYENIPIDFNVKDYTELNYDLRNCSEIEAKIHYELHGIYEKRKYKYENMSNDFNVKDYIELNCDLCNCSEIEAKRHYELHGFYEKRKYRYENIPNDFNVKDYTELNCDLCNCSEIEAKRHYELYGFYEKRRYIK